MRLHLLNTMNRRSAQASLAHTPAFQSPQVPIYLSACSSYFSSSPSRAAAHIIAEGAPEKSYLQRGLGRSTHLREYPIYRSVLSSPEKMTDAKKSKIKEFEAIESRRLQSLRWEIVESVDATEEIETGPGPVWVYRFEQSPSIRIHQADGYRGVFTTRDIPKGEPIFRSYGLILDTPQSDLCTGGVVLRAESRTSSQSPPVSQSYHVDWDSHMCWYDELEDQMSCYDVDCFTNHSCQPNSTSFQVYSDHETIDVYDVMALRDIKAGEEVLCDYATLEYDVPPELSFTCSCGAPNCRGAVGGFSDLSESEQLTILPFAKFNAPRDQRDRLSAMLDIILADLKKKEIQHEEKRREAISRAQGNRDGALEINSINDEDYENKVKAFWLQANYDVILGLDEDDVE